MSAQNIIYLVDDDADDRFLYREVLCQLQPRLTVIEADNGQQLVHILTQSLPLVPSLLVVDMNMPNMNGIEAMEALRKIGPFINVPAVMLSTSSDSGLAGLAVTKGYTEFHMKPAEYSAIQELMTELVTKYL